MPRKKIAAVIGALLLVGGILFLLRDAVEQRTDETGPNDGKASSLSLDASPPPSPSATETNPAKPEKEASDPDTISVSVGIDELVDSAIERIPDPSRTVLLDPPPPFGSLVQAPPHFRLMSGNFNGSQVLISPNGEQMAFIYMDVDSKERRLFIAVMGLSDGKIRTLLDEDAMAKTIDQMAWSSDSQWLAYVDYSFYDDENLSRHASISAIHVDSGEMRVLGEPYFEPYIAGIEQGEVIVVTRGTPGQNAFTVHGMPLNNAEERQISQFALDGDDIEDKYAHTVRMFQMRPGTMDLYVSRGAASDAEIKARRYSVEFRMFAIPLSQKEASLEEMILPEVSLEGKVGEYFRWNEDGTLLALHSPLGITVIDIEMGKIVKEFLNEKKKKLRSTLLSFVNGRIVFSGTPPGKGVLNDLTGTPYSVPYIVDLDGN